MDRTKRPKTANPTTFEYSTDLAAATFDRPVSRARSQFSDRLQDDENNLQVSRRPQSSLKNREMQTDLLSPNMQVQNDFEPTMFPMATKGISQLQPYLIPIQQNQMSPVYGVFYGPYPLPTVNGPPPSQMFNQSSLAAQTMPTNNFLQNRPRTCGTPSGGAQNVRYSFSNRTSPIIRAGRNGSSWRHIKQCTGNLGNTIMFIDGSVKEEDIRRFPPHGLPSSQSRPLSVSQRLACQQRGSTGKPFTYYTQFQDRAKNDFKYWYEDRKTRATQPLTIQGRIMKSGAAF